MNPLHSHTSGCLFQRSTWDCPPSAYHDAERPSTTCHPIKISLPDPWPSPPCFFNLNTCYKAYKLVSFCSSHRRISLPFSHLPRLESSPLWPFPQPLSRAFQKKRGMITWTRAQSLGVLGRLGVSWVAQALDQGLWFVGSSGPSSSSFQ